MSNRQSNGRFSSGTSGNSGGRPRSVIAMQLKAQHYAEDALSVLAQIMGSSKAPALARIAAAKELLDRGFGKSKQTVEMEPESVLNSLSTADLEALLKFLGTGTEEGESEAIPPV